MFTHSYILDICSEWCFSHFCKKTKIANFELNFVFLFSCKIRFADLLKKKKKKVVGWDLEVPTSSGYLVHCSYPFFTSIHKAFSASYSMLSQSFAIPNSPARLFINPEFRQCPLRCSCQLQLFWYLPQTACFHCISL